MLKAYTEHPRSFQSFRYVYVVLSRRSKGFSIGINLNPNKACNFDCIYCQVDRKVPGLPEPEPDPAALRQELEAMISLWKAGEVLRDTRFQDTPPDLQRLNDLAFSGDGEPTTAPQFLEDVQIAVDLKKRHGLAHVKILLLTDASRLDQPNVQQALRLLDRNEGEVWAKLDAGTEAYFRKVCRTKIPFKKILENATRTAQERPIVIQSLFLNLNDDGGPSPEELEAYIGRLKGIARAGGKIKRVQVYTVARKPAVDTVAALPPLSLEAIARRVRQEVGLPTEVHPGDWGL